MTQVEQKPSGVGPEDWFYPPSTPYRDGYLPLSNDLPGAPATPDAPQHQMYYALHGNPEGEPVFFIHGGPGGACTDILARFFDLRRYHVILFDQRGCGKSRPTVAEAGPKIGLSNNTTPHLVQDIDVLRRHLGYKKIHVFGGSWGSTLSLSYAIAHPDCVQSLILRGIFLVGKADLDYMYQGNAATYHLNPKAITEPGTYLVYPEAWKTYVEFIPVEKRGAMVAAYKEIFDMEPKTEAERTLQLNAARAWSVWEGSISYLTPDLQAIARFGEATFALCFAQIEAHYFVNNAFMPEGYLLKNTGKIAHIPVHIVHGRHDHVCPLMQAEQLVAALRAVGTEPASYIITTAGHGPLERETYRALATIMRDLPPLTDFKA